MNRYGWIVVWGVLLIGVSACRDSPMSQAGGMPLFPTLADRQDQLTQLRLRGAGDTVLVTLLRRDGQWHVVERGHWPADAARVSQYLFVLSQARGIEAKTDKPSLYPRLGVQPVADPAATGVELEMLGAGIRWRLLIGNAHPKFDAHYVRVDDRAQAWLTDLPVAFERSPRAWLDRRLLHLPLSRIASVRVADKDGASFELRHVDDRFRLVGVPSAAMHDSYQGDVLAATLDQLQFEDLDSAPTTAMPARTLQFLAVDGLRVQMSMWPQPEGLAWVTLKADVDAEQSAKWIAGTPARASDGALSAYSAKLNRRFSTRRFLLPAHVAEKLLLTEAGILAQPAAP